MKDNTNDDSGIEPISEVAKEVIDTLTGRQRTEPGEKFPVEEARKGDEPVDNLE